MPFIAQYASNCADCPEPIEPGDPIVYVPEIGYTHADCDDHKPSLALTGNQCPKCHLTMPLAGTCDCED